MILRSVSAETKTQISVRCNQKGFTENSMLEIKNKSGIVYLTWTESMVQKMTYLHSETANVFDQYSGATVGRSFDFSAFEV